MTLTIDALAVFEPFGIPQLKTKIPVNQVINTGQTSPGINLTLGAIPVGVHLELEAVPDADSTPTNLDEDIDAQLAVTVFGATVYDFTKPIVEHIKGSVYTINVHEGYTTITGTVTVAS
jgi:hypothetical protein